MSKKLFVDPARSLRLEHRRILQSDIALFLEHHEELETPALWMSKPQCASVGLAYIGGGTPPIGLLVEAWRNQHLTLPCVCGGTTYLWFASGSPLSGRHSLTGACPSCGALARPNILMFGDGGWLDERTGAQGRRQRQWLDDRAQDGLVIVECGAGTGVPTVRYESEFVVNRHDATLIRINVREPEVPAGQIGISMGAREALERIDALIE